ncbi:MAG: D-tyrosyl-tRNA(Tyr) deacylase [Kiritimatiellae bacterium]|nr:D-tyrosyl-tRNA(Tyr) deacylase [Kiritimatiellia bacterium]
MKLVVQRVKTAQVAVDNQVVAEMGPGAVVLVGIAKGDTQHDINYLSRKLSRLRYFDDEKGHLNAPIQTVQGTFLVVSQFTLYGDCRRGNRPSYIEAATPEAAKDLYKDFIERLQSLGHTVKTGVFREHMTVKLENDGPVTLILESHGKTAS